MAERPTDKQNWQDRQYDSYGPHFRIESGNPEMSETGTTVYSIMGQGTDNNTSTITMTKSGLMSIYNDQTMEIVGGSKMVNGCNVNIVGKNGDITITAMSNGDVKITAKNIIIQADENVDITAGMNINLNACKEIKLRSAIANCDALLGNLTPRNVTFGGLAYAGTSAGIDAVPGGKYI